MIPLSQDFFHYLLLWCWFIFWSGFSWFWWPFSIWLLSSQGSLWDCRTSGGSQSIHGTHACFPSSLPAGIRVRVRLGIQFPLPFFKAGATCAIFLPGTTSRAANSLLSSFFPWPFETRIRPSYINVYWYMHIGGRDKKKREKGPKRKQIRFLNLTKYFLVDPQLFFSKHVQKQKVQFTRVEKNRSS